MLKTRLGSFQRLLAGMQSQKSRDTVAVRPENQSPAGSRDDMRACERLSIG